MSKQVKNMIIEDLGKIIEENASNFSKNYNLRLIYSIQVTVDVGGIAVVEFEALLQTYTNR